MIGFLVRKIFGSKNDRFLKKLRPLVAKINALEPEMQALADEELPQRLAVYREQVQNGEKDLDAVLPEVFALVREASTRVLGMRHYDVQLLGAMALHNGKIAEMKTGEGKTLVATLAVILNSLEGKGVHVVTVNDYLAKRDAEWMGRLYNFLGLSVGVIVAGLSDEQRKEAYGADITYGTNNEFGFDYLRDNMKFYAEQLVQRGHHYAIVDEVDSILIDEARTPLIISGASEEVRELAHRIQAPVCDTLMGKGAFPGTDELYTGMLGMHGTKTSNYGVTKCDLLIVLGARFSDRVTGNAAKFANNAKIVQIDVDAAEINKNVVVESSIIGDVKEVLKRLNAKLVPMHHDEWIAKIREMKEKYPLKHEEGLTGPYVIEEIYKATDGQAIITTDVGQHQMWAAQYYRYTSPRTLLTSGGLGTMGFGLGAAMGAKMGRPDKTVINVAGDGCFRMNMNELATLSRHNIPVIEVVVNNHVLGMVRQWQTLFYGKRYSNTVLQDQADFVKVAEALGVKGIRVTKKEEMGPAIREAIEGGKPALIDVWIDCDEKVFPMVPAGAPIEDVFDAEDLAKKEQEKD